MSYHTKQQTGDTGYFIQKDLSLPKKRQNYPLGHTDLYSKKGFYFDMFL